MRRDPLGFLTECARRYGPVVEIRFPPFRNVLVTHPDGVRHVLHDNHRNYWKGVVLGRLRRIGGNGLLFSEGDVWRGQRRLMQPAFRPDRVARMAPIVIERTAELLDRWAAYAARGQPIDVGAEMSALALDVVARALFGTDLGAHGERFIGGVRMAMAYADHVVNHLFTPPLIVPTPANVRARRALAVVDDVIAEMIRARRRETGDHDDLLATLVRARDADTGAGMADRQLRDECLTLLTAGHETTAVALTWLWHLLAGHPHVERRLHDEVASAFDDRRPGAVDLDGLPFTRQVLEETMRLYPPAWALPRQAYQDDEIGGWPVPAGTPVTLSPYVTHRDPAVWERPEEFDPDRFAAARGPERPEYAYVPFGGGPRGCIGRELAMMEARLVVAAIVQRFRLVRASDEPV